MNRVASILLLLTFLGLGTGASEWLHDKTHEWEDAAEDAAAKAAGLPPPVHPVHDETNCPTHAQLHMPFYSAGWTPPLILLGIFLAFLTLMPETPLSHRLPIRKVCRGPPVHAFC